MTRPGAALAAAVAIVVAGIVTAGALTEDPIRDGRYVGYVRLLDGRDDAVAVDVVSIVRGVPTNATRAEVVVEAGGLATPFLLDRTPHPFRLVIVDGTIVGLESFDPGPRLSRRRAP